uniref:Uncharacterized protein n=1 Tax=Streptomyces sp. NBC_00093 TaxID=2975649 RepID=A0AAU1ZZX8_9ACTN
MSAAITNVKASGAEGVESLIAEFEAKREGADETLIEFIDHVVPVIREFGDAAAFANWFLAAVEERREKARGQGATAICDVYPDWCEERGPHCDHSRHYEGLVCYGTTHLCGSQLTLYVEENDFTPGEASAKAAELRDIADRIEIMAKAGGDQAAQEHQP